MYPNNINLYRTDNVSFKNISLSVEQSERATRYLTDYAKATSESAKDKIRIGLFNLFQPFIKKEAIIKSKSGCYISDDVEQNHWTLLYKTLEELIKPLENPLQILLNALNSYNPGSDELNPQYRIKEISLNKKLYGDDKEITLNDKISDEETLKPISQPNEEEKKIAKAELESKLKNTNLTDEEKNLIRLRGMGMTYTEMAKRYQLSDTVIRLHTLSAIAKMQDGYNILPKEYEDKAKELIQILELKQNFETVKKWLISYPEILPKDVNKIKENLTQLSQEFDTTYEKMLECGIKNRLLMYWPHETTKKNVYDFIEFFKDKGLTKEECINVFIKQPNMFYQTMKKTLELVNAYMYIDKNKLGNSGQDIRQIVLCKPLARTSCSLVYLRGIILPQLKKQDKTFLKWDKDNLKDKLTQYFNTHPNAQFTINLIEDEQTDNCINIIQECCREVFGRDNMFQFSKYTKETFLNELEKRLANTNLTEKEKNLLRLRAEGKTYDEIAKLCNLSIRQIRLYILTAEAKLDYAEGTLGQEYEDKANELIQVLSLKQNVETVTKWLVEHPEILPKDINKFKENIIQVSQIFNIDYTIMSERATVISSLFNISTDLIVEHIKAYRYSAINNCQCNTKDIDINQIVLNKHLTDSTITIYLRDIILPQLKNQDKEIAKWNTKNNLKNKLKTYFVKNPKRQFTIKLIEDEMTDDCIQTILEYCKKTFGRDDIFKFLRYTKEQLLKEKDDELKELKNKLAKLDLTERQRQVILLRAEGKTYDEIAKLYNITKGPMYRFIERANAKMQEAQNTLQ